MMTGQFLQGAARQQPFVNQIVILFMIVFLPRLLGVLRGGPGLQAAPSAGPSTAALIA